VGILFPRAVNPATDPSITSFRQGLRALGYVEGQNISLELRSSGGDNSRLPALAVELVALKPDVIVTNGEPAIRAAMGAAGAIPIVIAVVDDPVALGFVRSLAHPGGNVTGLSNLSAGLVTKRLETLLQIAQNPACVAVIRDPGGRIGGELAWQEVTAAAKTLGTALKPIAVASRDELESGFAEIARNGCRALLVMSSSVYIGVRRQFVELAARYRIPAIYDNRLFVADGGLMSYGPDTLAMYRRAASYVDKILKGARPSELPVEQPTKFEFVINLKVAKALGFSVPPTLLATADEVIE
jgi:putative ABC transport system substrate-binding protein